MGIPEFFTHSRHILALCFCKKTKPMKQRLMHILLHQRCFSLVMKLQNKPKNPMELPIAVNFLPPAVSSYICMLLDKLKEVLEDVLCY